MHTVRCRECNHDLSQRIALSAPIDEYRRFAIPVLRPPRPFPSCRLSGLRTRAAPTQMNVDAMTARMSVLTRALPRRVLLVDDDELDQDLLASRLDAAGFEVARASHGRQALELIERQWFPLVITDWQMPLMDGIELTRTLRSRGLDDTYVIMLSMRDSHGDYESGYTAGVDDYLPKTAPDAELFARMHAAFNTLALRRSLRQAQEQLEDSISIEAQSGAFASRELNDRLHAEIRRAQRYGRNLAVITIGVADASGAAPSSEVLRALVRTINANVRVHVDWVGRCEASSAAVFALVLPEAAVADAPSIANRVIDALRQCNAAQGVDLQFSVGAAGLDRTVADGAVVEAQDMLEVAAHCRSCPARASEAQLRAVQRSVGARLGIVCRHGYVLHGECALKPADDGRRGGAPPAD